MLGMVVVTALAASACGSSSSSGSATATTANAAAVNKLLGPKNVATGAPLKIGIITAGQTQAVDDRPELTMAQATVKYVNEHLGGIAGRPIELVSCADLTTPAGATSCANQMLAAKVPIVIDAEPANPSSTLKVLQSANVPYFTWEGADATLLESPDATTLGNPLAVLAAPIKLGKEDNVTKVAMVYSDVPAAGQLVGIAKPFYKNADMGLITTAVPLGTPDVTPQAQAALSAGAKEFLIVGDNSLCVSTLKALNTLGFKGKVVGNMNCLTGNAVPGGFDGLVQANISTPDPSNPDVALFQAVGATYAPGTPATSAGLADAGYAIVMGFQRAMKGIQPNALTSAGMAAQIKAMPPETMPLLAGQTFQCNRKVAPLTPAVCSNGAALVFLKPNGEVEKSESFDAGPYLKLS
jgi:branched-chain amino acid transport system substrate-binding protein